MLSSTDAQGLHLIDHSVDLYCITQLTYSKHFSPGCVKVAKGVSVLWAKRGVSNVFLTRTRCKELPFAALGYVCVVVLLRAGSRSQHCFPLPNLCTPMAASQRAALPWKGVDLPLLSIRREVQSFWFQQTRYPLVSEEFRFSTPLSFVFNFSPVKAFSCRIKAEIIN